MQKKNPAKRRPERLVATLLSLLFLSTAVFATVKYVFRAPELHTDKPVVTPDGTASTDVDRTGTDEPDALGRRPRGEEECNDDKSERFAQHISKNL